MTMSGWRASSSSSEPQASPRSRARSGTRSKQPTSRSSPSAPARLRPISPHPTTATLSKFVSGAALELEAEAKLLGAGGTHCLAGVVGPRRIDEQEATTAGSDELSAQRAGAASQRVEVVDAFVGHPG